MSPGLVKSDLLVVDIPVDRLVQDRDAGNPQDLLVVEAQETGRSCLLPSVVHHPLDSPSTDPPWAVLPLVGLASADQPLTCLLGATVSGTFGEARAAPVGLSASAADQLQEEGAGKTAGRRGLLVDAACGFVLE